MNRIFQEWFNTMIDNIHDYQSYVDWDTVYKNVEKVKIELHILNSLINSPNIKDDLRKLLSKYPEVIKCIPILLAIREYEIKILNGNNQLTFNFQEADLHSKEKYITLMEKTGLLEMISQRLINNLIDYVLGVEVGMNSNARKNRIGKKMEALVEQQIKKTGLQYFKNINIGERFPECNYNLSYSLDEDLKRKKWDFIIHANDVIYVIETNFYNSNGSKINETSRSYQEIAHKIQKIKGVVFIWITDGQGWKSSKSFIQENFHKIQHFYNINDLQNGVLQFLLTNKNSKFNKS